MDQSSHIKFTVIPKSSVALYAETVGCGNLNDNVLSSLSEDVTYRLRETLQNAIRLMRHSKRRCMTTEDFNKALKWSNTQPIYGHNGVDIANFKSLSFKDKVISYIEDKDLSLRETTFDQTLPADPGEVSIKAQWLVFEGHSCSGGKTSRDEITKRDILEEPHSSFLEQTISAAFGKNFNARKVAIDNLRTSDKLQSILPYLVTFLASQVKACNGNDTLKSIARGTLLIVQALVDNISLFLVPYLLQIVKLLLFIIIEGHLPVSLWECKVTAARILTHLCRRHISTNSYLPHQVLKAYQECLNDDSKPLGSVYGAAFGISCLGTEPVHQIFQAVLIKKCEALRATIDSSSEINVIQESLMVYGLFQNISLFLLRSAYSSPGNSSYKTNQRAAPSSPHKYFAIYNDLLTIFDEGIVAFTHFPAFSNNSRALLQLTMLFKPQRSLNLRSRNSTSVPISDAKIVCLESAESRKACLISKRSDHHLSCESQMRMNPTVQANSSTTQTSIGAVLTRTKWKCCRTQTSLDVFQELENERGRAEPSRPKRRKISSRDSKTNDEQKPKKLINEINSQNIRTMRIPCSNFANLARIPNTVNILW